MGKVWVLKSDLTLHLALLFNNWMTLEKSLTNLSRLAFHICKVYILIVLAGRQLGGCVWGGAGVGTVAVRGDAVQWLQG